MLRELQIMEKLRSYVLMIKPERERERERERDQTKSSYIKFLTLHKSDDKGQL